jgi:transposase
MRLTTKTEYKMKLRKIGIMALQASTKMRNRIAELEKVTPQTINRWVRDNDDMLTKAATLSILREETGLTDEQLLEQVAETAKV